MDLTDLLGEAADDAVGQIEQFARALLRRSYASNPFVRRWEDDIVQQVLMTAFDWAGRVDRGEAVVRNTDAWLVRVIFNTKNQTWRRSGAGREVEVSEPVAPNAEARPLSLTDRLALRQALERLDGECRELLVRFHALGESANAMATAYDLSPGNIRVKLHRCRRKLLVMHEGASTSAA